MPKKPFRKESEFRNDLKELILQFIQDILTSIKLLSAILHDMDCRSCPSVTVDEQFTGGLCQEQIEMTGFVARELSAFDFGFKGR